MRNIHLGRRLKNDCIEISHQVEKIVYFKGRKFRWKKVGWMKDGLNVNFIKQQDKFEQAASLIANSKVTEPKTTPNKTHKRAASNTNSSYSASTPWSMAKIAKQKHWFGSSEYWKCMFEQSQSIIQESCEKSLKLDEIPWLLTVETVNPKEVNKKKIQE